MMAAAMVSGNQAAAASSGTLEIKLGQTIDRTWEDVAKVKYAYGPKQTFDAATQETHVWLPYGSQGVYYETAGLTVTDANFVGGWGWNFRTDAVGSANEFWVREVRVRKP